MEKNNHYYSRNQDNLKSKETEYKLTFLDKNFRFITDSGVFSKNYIDYGSFVMLKKFKPNDIESPILDMGCGYGPIGIVVAKIYQKKVIMADINERAVMLANKNIEINDVKKYASAYQSDLFSNIPDDKYSSIISNPPIRAGKSVCQAIYKGSYERLDIGGELWIVIQKKQGAPSTGDFLKTLFGNCETLERDKGYFIYKCVKLH